MADPKSDEHSPANEELYTEDGVFDPSAAEDDEVAGVRFSITSYGADYPVDALVARLKSEAIKIPEFQRGYVWTLPQASRFIESLLLGLPVPAIFLSKDPETQQLLVIDGQQRLTTLKRFYAELFEGRQFRLRGVSGEFEGKGIGDLSEEDRRRLDDSLLHAIIVNQTEPKSDRTGLYNLFERINTGGTPLQPQEIRWCIYRGDFLKLIRELNGNDDWREIYGRMSKRSKDEELILRFFALLYNSENYTRPMKEFLNKFTNEHRKLDRISGDQFKQIFETVVALARGHLGPAAFRPTRNLNAALLESVLVGIARRVQAGPIMSPGDLRAKLSELVSNNDFADMIESNTTDEKRLAYRLREATRCFSEVQ